MILDNQDLEWLSTHFHIDIRDTNKFQEWHESQGYLPSSMLEHPIEIRRSKIYNLEIRDIDLAYLIRVIKDYAKHEHLQKTYPGVREAWMNYIMTVHMTYDMIHSPSPT
jgi:hypothetical protein